MNVHAIYCHAMLIGLKKLHMDRCMCLVLFQSQGCLVTLRGFNLFLFFGFRKKMTTTVTAMSRVDKFSKSDIIVSPSILSANFAKLGEQVFVIFFHCFMLCPYFSFLPNSLIQFKHST